MTLEAKHLYKEPIYSELFAYVPMPGMTIEVKCNLKPAGNYMFKANKRNTSTRCRICLKLKRYVMASFWCLYC